jgi:4-amino-4-deoxy-L-arabinose transferase-like glycosyltransferase
MSRYVLIPILVLGLLCSALMLNAHLVPAGDNATYLVLGQSLATGQGYRMVSDPRAPQMALYPPGYPLVLATVLAVTGTTRQLLAAVLPLKWLSIALFLASIALTYDLLRRRSTVLAVLTSLLMAVNPQLVHFANEVGTEIPYLFLSLACIWLFERAQQQPGTRAMWGVAILVACAFYVRSIALVLVVAFVLSLLAARQSRRALLLVIVTAGLALPWFASASSLPSTGTSVGLGRGYFALFLSSDPYGAQQATLPQVLSRVMQNLRIYALDIWPTVLFAHASGLARVLGPVGVAVPLAISMLIVLGFAREARHGRASEWYAALFFAACAGYLWAQSRLIVPIIPFAIYYFGLAVQSLLDLVLRSAPKLKAPALVLVLLALTASALTADLRSIQDNLRYGLDRPVDDYYARDSEWDNYLRSIRWITDPSSRRLVVMCRKADLLYVLTGHQALEYPYSPDGMELLQAAHENQVEFIIEDAFTWTRTTEQYLRPALESWRTQRPDSLSLAYETSAPHTRVWRVQLQ